MYDLPLREQNQETSPTPKKRSLKQKALLTAGALTIAGTSFSFGRATQPDSRATETKPTAAAAKLPSEADITHIATETVLQHEEAKNYAKFLSDDLNQNRKVAMTLLNGKIESKFPDGQYHAIVEDAILLGPFDQDENPSDYNDYLNDKWFGTQGADQQGNSIINLFTFNRENMRFVPALDDNYELFLKPSVYATTVNQDNGFTYKQMTGYDTEGDKNFLKPNGAPLIPGHIIGGKGAGPG